MSETKKAFRDTEVEKTLESEKIITVRIKSTVTLDGQILPPEMTVKVSIKQWRALSRHFEFIDGPKDQAPKGWNAAVAIIALLLTLLCPKAEAGTTVINNTLPGAWIPTNASGNTGLAAAKTNYWVPMTNSAGAVTNFINLSKFDECVLTFTGTDASSAGMSNTLVIVGGDGSSSNWDTNHPLATCTLTVTGGTNGVLVTNLSRNVIGSTPAAVIWSAANLTGADASTNLQVKVTGKSIRSGQ
jgi:hypothetical protein